MTELWFKLFSWTTLYGVLILFIWFVYRFIKQMVITFEKQPSLTTFKGFIFSIGLPFILIMVTSIGSDLMLLHLLRKELATTEISIIKISNLYHSAYELENSLEEAYHFKLESGHSSSPQDFMEFSLDAYPSIHFRINRDRPDRDMYWLSIDSILGYQSIGFIRLP